MTETGVGWPSQEYPEHGNVKLTEYQKIYIKNSGEPESLWIRQAVAERIERETEDRERQAGLRDRMRGNISE